MNPDFVAGMLLGLACALSGAIAVGLWALRRPSGLPNPPTWIGDVPDYPPPEWGPGRPDPGTEEAPERRGAVPRGNGPGNRSEAPTALFGRRIPWRS